MKIKVWHAENHEVTSLADKDKQFALSRNHEPNDDLSKNGQWIPLDVLIHTTQLNNLLLYMYVIAALIYS